MHFGPVCGQCAQDSRVQIYLKITQHLETFGLRESFGFPRLRQAKPRAWRRSCADHEQSRFFCGKIKSTARFASMEFCPANPFDGLEVLCSSNHVRPQGEPILNWIGLTKLATGDAFRGDGRHKTDVSSSAVLMTMVFAGSARHAEETPNLPTFSRRNASARRSRFTCAGSSIPLIPRRPLHSTRP